MAVVSDDTGPLHLAAAVGAATVGTSWCFNHVTGGPVELARHRAVMAGRTHCSACCVDRATGSSGHHPSFVADVRTDEVVAPKRELLAAGRGGAATVAEAAAPT